MDAQDLQSLAVEQDLEHPIGSTSYLCTCQAAKVRMPQFIRNLRLSQLTLGLPHRTDLGDRVNTGRYQVQPNSSALPVSMALAAALKPKENEEKGPSPLRGWWENGPRILGLTPLTPKATCCGRVRD